MKHALLLVAALLATISPSALRAEELESPLIPSSIMVSAEQGGRIEQRQPHLCLLHNGRTVATWVRRYEPKRQGNCVYSSHSDDGGRSWSEPVLVSEGVGKNEFVYCDGKRIWNFHTLNASEGAGTLAIRTSDDGGVTWQPLPATQPAAGRFPVTDGRVVRVEGRYLLAGHFPIEYNDPNRGYCQGVVYASDDLQNWRELASVGDGRREHTVGEPQLLPLGGPEILLVARTYKYTSVAGSVLVANSRDAGRTWSHPVPMNEVPNADTKPCYLLLPDGRHVAVYNKPKPGRAALFLKARRGLNAPWGKEVLLNLESGWAYAADGVVIGQHLLVVWESDAKKSIRSALVPLDAIP